MRYCRPAPVDTILDVGVSDVVTDGANMLEQQYPYPDRITGAGLGQGHAFRAAFPKVRFRQIEPGCPLPFADKAFAIAASNAVLEHVGSVHGQCAFVRELVRVAHRVFISVPNRYFPVEHHTAIPVLHYWSPAFAAACRVLDKPEWADQANLILMSRTGLAAVIPEGANVAIGTTGIALGPFSSNLFACITDGDSNNQQPTSRGPDQRCGVAPPLVSEDLQRSHRLRRSAEDR
jgi:hypothetical protein